MSAPRRTIEDKVGDWLTAYNAVATELTPREFRYGTSNEDPERRRIVFANDRMAALVAALLVGTGGTRPIPVDTEGV